MNKDFEFMRAFNPQNNWVKEFDYWLILVRADQVTLGDCIFVLKREITSFGEMTYAEGAELRTAINWYEKKCERIFGAEKFNYIAAMMRDNFAHFHAFPRYSGTIHKYNMEWTDERWPRVIQFAPHDVGNEVLQKIINELRD